jgi:serine/threonine-protein kinase
MAENRSPDEQVGGLAEEYLARHRQGLKPSVESYAAAHPEIADEIRRLFPALLMMEELKPASGDATGSFDGTAVVVRGARLERLGDFRILREVGRGGMGVVYEAEQESLGRRVALKVLTAHHLPDPAHLRRFEREARAAAKLHHTNIVPVFGVGVQEGLHYYVMQFIQGLGLDDVIAELKRLRSGVEAVAPLIRSDDPDLAPTAAGIARSLITEGFVPGQPVSVDPSATETGPPDGSGAPARPPRAVTPAVSSEVMFGSSGLSSGSGTDTRYWRGVARIGVQVARALEYAHTQGIFHRDVKPSNLLLDIQGTAWVADFGLAKAVEGENLTHTGDIVGTIRYMAPERFRGKCDARSDVYAVGLTLYEMLALRPAFEQSDRQALMQQVLEQEPQRLRTLNPAVPRDLETVVHKAIAKEPAGRYATAAALAEDLALYIDGKPVRARATGTLERCWKWAKRRPTVAALLAGLSVAVLTGLAAVTWQWRSAVAARNDALTARNDALAARDQARQNFELARKAVDDYLTRVGQNPLLKEQGLHDLRQELLELALGYYRDFLRQRGDDPNLRADTAAAHGRVGDIMSELGHFGDALASYDQALALIEPVVRDRPGDPGVATAQVRFQAGRLQALKDTSSYAEAIAGFERVKDLGEALLAAGGGTDDLPDILARIHDSAAFVFRNTKRTDDALRASLRAHELAELATRKHPGDTSAARTRLWVSRQAAFLLRMKGQLEKARRLCEQDIAFGKALVGEHPHDVEMRMYQAGLEYTLGQIERSDGRPLEALKIFRSEVDTLSALARENPLLIRSRWLWANALLDLSNLQVDIGRYAEAEQCGRVSVDLSEALVREVPSSSLYRITAGYACGFLGKALLKRGSLGEALAMLRKSAALLETSDEVNSLYNRACFLALASTVADPAEGPAAERRRRDADQAVATIRRAIEMGFAESNTLRTDPDFDSIRARPDFQALVMDLAFPADPLAP